MHQAKSAAGPRLAALSVILVSTLVCVTGCLSDGGNATSGVEDGNSGVELEKLRFTNGIGFCWAAEGWARPVAFTQGLPRGSGG